MLELPRGGKIRAQDAAVRSARGEIVAFSDANALWEPDAARALVGAFADPRVGYACGRSASCSSTQRPCRHGATRRQPGGSTGATSSPCARSSRACRSITAGNGAIYATRRDAYIVVDPIMGHDLSLPFNMVKRGLRAVYVPRRAREREDGALARGRVRAQAAHDEPHLADPAARRHALAARLPAAATR